jgi:uncharacterized protein (DUF1919 family)
MKRLLAKVTFRLQAMQKSAYLAKNRSRLKCDDFAVISSNCLGGILYKDLGLPYQTPFVNMYMFPECFLKMMGDFQTYMQHELLFTGESKYPVKVDYPLGVLNDVEIHFIHFKTTEDVIRKWNERKDRINYDKIIPMMCERDGATREAIEKFDKLPYRNKLCFTMQHYPHLKSVVPLGGSLFYRETPPADQMAGFAYVKADIIGFINRTCG